MFRRTKRKLCGVFFLEGIPQRNCCVLSVHSQEWGGEEGAIGSLAHLLIDSGSLWESPGGGSKPPMAGQKVLLEPKVEY